MCFECSVGKYSEVNAIRLQAEREAATKHAEVDGIRQKATALLNRIDIELRAMEQGKGTADPSRVMELNAQRGQRGQQVAKATQAAEQTAAALGAAGADTVIFTLRNPYRAQLLEPLAVALAAL